jgi:hypothetical protein
LSLQFLSLVGKKLYVSSVFLSLILPYVQFIEAFYYTYAILCQRLSLLLSGMILLSHPDFPDFKNYYM